MSLLANIQAAIGAIGADIKALPSRFAALSGSSAQSFSVGSATQSQHAVALGQVQSQSGTAFTAGGTAPSYTLTPSPAITAYAANQRFNVTFSSAGTTGSNTISISGKGAIPLKQYAPDGSLVPGVVTAGMTSDVQIIGAGSYALILDPVPSGYATVTAVNDPTFADDSVNPASTGWVRRAMSAIATAAGFACSLTPNGYIKLPSWLGGVVTQWGSVSLTGGKVLAVTLPITFPNRGFQGVAVNTTTRTGANDQGGMNVSEISTTTITIVNTIGSVTRTARWFAIGY